MKKIVLTGSSGGIGDAIIKELAGHYEVICFGSRLEDLVSVETESKEILKISHVDVLINCAGFGVFEPHEEISIATISQLIAVNLTAPLVLTKLFLRSLKETKGHIINITSVEATRHSKFSALYTASKSGLRDFSLALFEEVRKSGVRVTSINPDMTKTSFFDELNFEPSANPSAHLDPLELARVIRNILELDGVVTDITMRPQKLEITKKSKT